MAFRSIVVLCLCFSRMACGSRMCSWSLLSLEFEDVTTLFLDSVCLSSKAVVSNPSRHVGNEQLA